MGKGFGQVHLQRKYTKGQQAHEKEITSLVNREMKINRELKIKPVGDNISHSLG